LCERHELAISSPVTGRILGGSASENDQDDENEPSEGLRTGLDSKPGARDSSLYFIVDIIEPSITVGFATGACNAIEGRSSAGIKEVKP
jgi:hypothetical protein